MSAPSRRWLGQPRDAWVPVGATFANSSSESSRQLPLPRKMSGAFQSGDAPRLQSRRSHGYRVLDAKRTRCNPEPRKGAEEFLFNQTEPFYKSMVIYVAAVLLGRCLFVD